MSSRPFTHTGVDYAGPFTIKTWKGRGAKTYKAWICVISKILKPQRHYTQRYILKVLHSDCGTTFVGADKDKRKLFLQGTTEHHPIINILTEDNARWEYNPPAVPHMQGKWEAIVNSIKFHLRRSTRGTLLTIKEITTLLSQIEAILNSRPLQLLSDDPDDCSTLTPDGNSYNSEYNNFDHNGQNTIYKNNYQHQSSIIHEMKS
ncbi:PREDICTED: uncharacterized protein LOC105366133 [Ceratosolen solmsi marchali]|uniref:Uncharacterized protein LOC105366133 n=1 Tax=Ceratosolen solmsi marchali TaxID=326594 RepID=A0AAJ6YRA4_9HYME|nr:PREDICTED: uncharacterized protein LOC105366133 [Ceratosolen solmsi marchali]